MSTRLKARARDIMRKDVPTVSLGASIAEAVRVLIQCACPCAVVVGEEGRPVGIVTERDLLPMAMKGEVPVGIALRQILQDESHVLDFLRELRKADARNVAEVMSSPVRCADVDMTVAQVAGIMEAFDYRQVPVVSEGRLVGLVTRQDILRAIAAR